MSELSEKARKLKNAYIRQWRLKNPDKVRQYTKTYWERQADPIGAEVRKLSQQGLSQRQIAERLNISLGTTNKMLNI